MNCSRRIKAMTAQSTMDIQSSAMRLRPKPMLPKNAKPARMSSRKQNRTRTWADFSFCGRFRSGYTGLLAQAKLSLNIGW
jgi:hypothetical protein